MATWLYLGNKSRRYVLCMTNLGKGNQLSWQQHNVFFLYQLTGSYTFEELPDQNWQYTQSKPDRLGIRPQITQPCHDDVIKWKHFRRYWPFVLGIHRSPWNSPHKGQWPETLMFDLIYARINCWVNNREAGDSRRHRAHYDAIVMHFTAVKVSSLQPLDIIL